MLETVRIEAWFRILAQPHNRCIRDFTNDDTQNQTRCKPESREEKRNARRSPALWLKTALVKVCKQDGTTVSDTVRRLISEHVFKAEASLSQPALKDITMTIAKNPRKTLGMTAAAALSAFLFTAQPSMADAELFSSFDHNKDGKITIEEINPDVVRILDANHDKAIALGEFKPVTEMQSINDDIRETSDQRAEREIKVAFTKIDLSQPGNSSVNIWSASEIIPVDASDAEVKAMIADLKDKVTKGQFSDHPVPPTPPPSKN